MDQFNCQKSFYKECLHVTSNLKFLNSLDWHIFNYYNQSID